MGVNVCVHQGELPMATLTEGKLICPKCYGNGFRRVWKDSDEKVMVEIDCAFCNNQGEVDITEDNLKAIKEENDEASKRNKN